MATTDNPSSSTDHGSSEESIHILHHPTPFDDTLDSVSSTLSSSTTSFVQPPSSSSSSSPHPSVPSVKNNDDTNETTIDTFPKLPVSEHISTDGTMNDSYDNDTLPILASVAANTTDPSASSFSSSAALSVADTVDNVHLPSSASSSTVVSIELPTLPSSNVSVPSSTVAYSASSPASVSSPSYVVRMRNVHKTYLLGLEGVAALRGVTLDIEAHEFIVILGKSGGGKTTMLNILGTIDKPTRGDLALCGHIINDKTSDQLLANIRLNDIGFVFQTFNLLPGLTALENVELPMILSGQLKSVTERRQRAIRLLSRVGMYERMDHYPSEMSGGEQQRVTIARALANNPRILLLDEPTGDLDTVNTDIILRILTDLNRHENVTCILVTHDINLKNYAHRVIHMLDGKINRIESIPSFIREDAFDILDSKASVQSWLRIQDEEKLKNTNTNGSGNGSIYRGNNSFIHTAFQSLSQLQQGIGSIWSNTLAQLQGYSMQDPSGILPGSRTSTSDSLPSPSSMNSPSPASSSRPTASDNSVVVVVPDASTRNNGTTTSTGLSGVAAISHSLYSAHAIMGTENKVGSTGNSSGTSTVGISTVTRSPSNYVTYNYSIKAKEQALIEANEQKLREQRKEEKLRKKINALAQQRHQQQKMP